MNNQLNLFDITKSIGLCIPKIVLDYLEKAYSKTEIINILSETVGYDITTRFNVKNYLYSKTVQTNYSTTIYDSSSDDFQISDDSIDELNNYENQHDIDYIRNKFYKKYMEKMSSCFNLNQYNISTNNKIFELERLPEKWIKVFQMNLPNKLLNQDIITKAYKLNLLDLLDPNFALDTNRNKLLKAWYVINKYELWIENYNDPKYWDKLNNLIDREYYYIKN